MGYFNEKVAKVKFLWNESTPTVHLDIHAPNPSQGTLVGGTMGTPVKLIYLSSLPLSSGEDLDPKMKLTMSSSYYKLGGTEFSLKRQCDQESFGQ